MVCPIMNGEYNNEWTNHHLDLFGREYLNRTNHHLDLGQQEFVLSILGDPFKFQVKNPDIDLR